MQLIHLALRLAWPTNYLSKGRSQALRGFCSFWHSEGKRSPQNPSDSQRGTGSEGTQASLAAAHCWILVFSGQTWARECPKNQVGLGKHKSCRHLVSRLLLSYSDPSLSLSPVCNTHRMECNTWTIWLTLSFTFSSHFPRVYLLSGTRTFCIIVSCIGWAHSWNLPIKKIIYTMHW